MRKKILVIDIGGSHVKLMISQRIKRRKFDSGRTLTPRKFVTETKKEVADWKYDAIAIGFPAPALFLTAINAVEMVGGVGLFFNVWTSYVAVTLIVFLIFATITIHGPLVRDPVTGTDQIVHIIKNIAIIGGLLTFVAF